MIPTVRLSLSLAFALLLFAPTGSTDQKCGTTRAYTPRTSVGEGLSPSSAMLEALRNAEVADCSFCDLQPTCPGITDFPPDDQIVVTTSCSLPSGIWTVVIQFAPGSKQVTECLPC